MPCPLLTPTNLNSGIKKFLSHPRWRKDFHNLFYTNVTSSIQTTGNLSSPSVGAYFQRGKYGPDLWYDIIGELSFWKALRPSPISGFTSHLGLPNLQSQYGALKAALTGASHFPVANPFQPQIINLFNAAMGLKPRSIVFASKCCHMLVPWEFPISDGKFSGINLCREKMVSALEDWNDLDQSTRSQIGSTLQSSNFNYWSYRHFILTAWDTLPAAQKNQLIQILNRAILFPGMGPVWNSYPYRTRISELCLA